MQTERVWNPMEDDFKNQAFNKYESGPGAELDDNLQPGAIAKNKANADNNFVICLKQVPLILGEVGVRNLCSSFGKVASINTSTKTPFIFVRMATMNDMERCLTGLRNNTFGIIAEVAKQSQKTNVADADSSTKSDTSSIVNRHFSNIVNMSRRSIKGPFTNPPRPNIDVTKIVSQNAGNITRSPQKTSVHFDIKNKNISAEYLKSCPGIDPSSVSIENCKRCGRLSNKICQRCNEYYCSLECQKIDWPKHKYVCFPMPKLVTSDSQDIGLVDNTIFVPPSVSESLCSKKSGVELKHHSSDISEKSGSEHNLPRGKKKGKQDNTKCSALHKTKATDFPKSGSLVYITAVNTTNELFIRSANKSESEEYIKMLNEVNVKGMESKPIQHVPKMNDIVITEFQESGFYRAKVLSIENPDQISVRYLDFGNTEVKQLSELRELPEEVMEFSYYIHLVTLKNVPDFTIPEKLSAIITSYVDNMTEFKILYDQLEGKIQAELINMSTNDNLNNKIIQLKHVREAKISDPPVFVSDIPMKLIPAGEKIHAYVFDNSLVMQGVIHCILEENIPKLTEYNQEFEEYAKKVEGPYTPRTSEMCLAQYEDDAKWYRAECVETVGDGSPSVMFIDFGNVSPVHINKIRKYPKDLIRPCYTCTCLISDLPEDLSQKVANRLKELIPLNEKIFIDKVEENQEDQVNFISLNQVINTLKAEHLI